MGVKYTVPYKDSFNQQCRIDIIHPPYAGAPITLRAAAEQACTITHDMDEDPSEPIVNSKASITLVQEETLDIDIYELQLAQDREFQVEFYIMGELKWSGFLVPDGIAQTYQSTPFDVTLEAVDGLSLLSDIPYVHANLEGGRCVLNYFRQILFSNMNLRLPLPIRWAIQVTNDQYPMEADVFTGSMRWSQLGEGFQDYNGNYKDCRYILEYLLKAFRCRIMQSNGKWVVWRLPDVASGVFSTRETPATLSGFTVTDNASASVVKDVGGAQGLDYHPIDEDASLRVLSALKSVTVTYKQDQRENIVPNGNMDLVDTVTNRPFFWGGTGLSVISVPSLSGAAGNAAEVENISGDTNYLRASRPPENVFKGPSPRFEMNFFFRGTARTGDVIFLSDRDADTGIEVNTYTYTIPAWFDGNTNGALLDFATSPDFFEVPSVDYEPTTQEYRFYWEGQNKRIAGRQNIFIAAGEQFSFNRFLPIDTDVLYGYMNFGFKFSIKSGAVLDGMGLIDWDNTPNTIRVTYNAGTEILYLNEFGFWVTVPTDIQITVAQLKIGDVAQVDFNNFQNIILPLPDVLPIGRTNPPEINVRFNIPPGRNVVFDDVYITVPQNSDVYSATDPVSTNTKSEEYELQISSSHNGFYVSNLMTGYADSGLEKFYSDSRTQGATLTELFALSVMRHRYLPSLLYSGSIYGRTKEYAEMYNIVGLSPRIFLPLRSVWNTETNTAQVDLVEIRDDVVTLVTNHYGTEDNSAKLSN